MVDTREKTGGLCAPCPAGASPRRAVPSLATYNPSTAIRRSPSLYKGGKGRVQTSGCFVGIDVSTVRLGGYEGSWWERPVACAHLGPAGASPRRAAPSLATYNPSTAIRRSPSLCKGGKGRVQTFYFTSCILFSLPPPSGSFDFAQDDGRRMSFPFLIPTPRPSSSFLIPYFSFLITHSSSSSTMQKSRPDRRLFSVPA